MDLHRPRAVYQRANTDEYERDDYELGSIASIQSFNSTKTDQARLLDFSPDFLLPSPPLVSLKASWQAAIRRAAPKQLHGWKLGALGASILAGFSLVINIIVAAWLGSHKQESGLVEVYNGSCEKVAVLDLWSHLAINVLSTLLLGGSNYCMQCLCAPTRADVDRAHQRWRYVDVGVPSFRNLITIPRFKAVLWWILALSSIPLHLLYNSALYKSIVTNDYNIVFAQESFLDGVLTYNNTWDISNAVDLKAIQRNITTDAGNRYERLDKASCIKTYATDFIDKRRNLVFILSPGNATIEASNFSVYDLHHYIYDATYSYLNDNYRSDGLSTEIGSVSASPYQWICQCDSRLDQKIEIPPPESAFAEPACSRYYDKIIQIADEWQPFDHNVDYCLSEIVPQHCSYNGNISILIVVIVCNFIKMVCMLITAFRLGPGSLITIGDAVASFLTQPDSTTKGHCLLSRDEVRKDVGRQTSRSKKEKGLPALPKTAHIQKRKWASAASWLRWVYTISLILLGLVVSSVLLKMALGAIRGFGISPLSLKIGAVSPAAIVTGWTVGSFGSPSSRIMKSILIANTPQMIFSFLYLNLNGLLTTMWLAEEWSDFASQRKALRTSKPKGLQRSTHHLQLPYRISIPLMIVSGVLHWLISQSVFLAVVAEYLPNGKLDSPVAIASCGFSPIAMIITIVLGFVLVLATFAVGQRKYNASMPLVGSCSIAISAACHRPEWDTDAAVKPVIWGVIPPTGIGFEPMIEEVGHASFTSGEVLPLEEGKEYR